MSGECLTLAESAAQAAAAAEKEKENVKSNVASALEAYRLTEFYRLVIPAIAAGSVRRHLEEARSRAEKLETENEAFMRAAIEKNEAARQEHLHCAPLENVEREMTRTIAAESNARELIPNLEAAVAAAKERLARTSEAKEKAGKEMRNAEEEAAELKLAIEALEFEIGELQIQHEAKRAPLFQAANEAEKLASEMRDWRMMERQLRAEMERLETERASLTTAAAEEEKKKRLRLRDEAADDISIVAKKQTQAVESEVFYW